jgi:hypothetical protein
MDIKVVIVYGFEYDKLIKYTKKLILCKSIKTGLPVYCSIMIEDTIDILKKMENIEQNHMQQMKEIDEYRNIRFAEQMPCWQMALYAPNLVFTDLQDEEIDNDNDFLQS